MPTSVVTGGAGFLGSHLCDRLLADGHRVICVDNLDTGTLENIEHIRSGDFVFMQHDVTEHRAARVQRVDDDDAGVTLDEGDVGQIQPADLVDAFDHLVETLLGAQLRLPP